MNLFTLYTCILGAVIGFAVARKQLRVVHIARWVPAIIGTMFGLLFYFLGVILIVAVASAFTPEKRIVIYGGQLLPGVAVALLAGYATFLFFDPRDQ